MDVAISLHEAVADGNVADALEVLGIVAADKKPVRILPYVLIDLVKTPPCIYYLIVEGGLNYRLAVALVGICFPDGNVLADCALHWFADPDKEMNMIGHYHVLLEADGWIQGRKKPEAVFDCFPERGIGYSGAAIEAVVGKTAWDYIAEYGHCGAL